MPRPHLRLLKLCGHDMWSTKSDLTATRQGATESGGIDGGGMVQECPGMCNMHQYANLSPWPSIDANANSNESLYMSIYML
jgi:hypothetical protein